MAWQYWRLELIFVAPDPSTSKYKLPLILVNTLMQKTAETQTLRPQRCFQDQHHQILATDDLISSKPSWFLSYTCISRESIGIVMVLMGSMTLHVFFQYHLAQEPRKRRTLSRCFMLRIRFFSAILEPSWINALPIFHCHAGHAPLKSYPSCPPARWDASPTAVSLVAPDPGSRRPNREWLFWPRGFLYHGFWVQQWWEPN